jgi:hypothetical protein
MMQLEGAGAVKFEVDSQYMVGTAMSFALQYVSDIHLEFHDKHNAGRLQPDIFVKPGGSEYLALIGDIGYPEKAALPVFLEWCSKNWKEVFWIPGNHEYYTHGLKEILTYTQKNELMEQIGGRWPNVHFLNRKTFDIGTVRLAGCCLWSNIPEEKDHEILSQMNDSRNIYAESGRNAVPRDIRGWFQRDCTWISEQIQLAKEEQKELIILTHYLPSFRMIHPKYEGHPLNYGFASNLEHMIQSPVRAWLCGHSHSSVDCIINGAFCSLNPHGYPNENQGQINRCKVFKLKLNYDESEHGEFVHDESSLRPASPCESYDFV